MASSTNVRPESGISAGSEWKERCRFWSKVINRQQALDPFVRVAYTACWDAISTRSIRSLNMWALKYGSSLREAHRRGVDVPEILDLAFSAGSQPELAIAQSIQGIYEIFDNFAKLGMRYEGRLSPDLTKFYRELCQALLSEFAQGVAPSFLLIGGGGLGPEILSGIFNNPATPIVAVSVELRDNLLAMQRENLHIEVNNGAEDQNLITRSLNLADLTPETIDHWQHEAQETGKSIVLLVKGYGEDVFDQGLTFDCAVCTRMFHHVPRDAQKSFIDAMSGAAGRIVIHDDIGANLSVKGTLNSMRGLLHGHPGPAWLSPVLRPIFKRIVPDLAYIFPLLIFEGVISHIKGFDPVSLHRELDGLIAGNPNLTYAIDNDPTSIPTYAIVSK